MYVNNVIINEKTYTVSIEIYKNKRLICINNKIVSYNYIDLSLKPYAHLFYDINIGVNKITISITMKGNKEHYDIYVDDISVNSGQTIYFERDNAQKNIECGWIQYFKSHWKEVLYRECKEFLLTILLGFSFLLFYSWKKKIFLILLGVPIMSILLPLFVWFDYLKNKNIIRTWEDQYQISVLYEDLDDFDFTTI